MSQLRQAADAAREGSWALPTIDTKANIRSVYGPLGGAGRGVRAQQLPVRLQQRGRRRLRRRHRRRQPGHRQGQQLAPRHDPAAGPRKRSAALETAKLPARTVQLIYRTDHETASGWWPHPASAPPATPAVALGGARLKEAADRAGKPIYLELSSINPVADPARRPARARRGDRRRVHVDLPDGHGPVLHQPRPGAAPRGPESDTFIERVREKFAAAPVGTLLSARRGKIAAPTACRRLRAAGAELLVGGAPGGGRGYSHQHAAPRLGRRLPGQPGRSADRGLRQRHPARRGPRSRSRPRAVLDRPRGQPHRLRLFRHGGQRRRRLRAAWPRSCAPRSAACSTTRCPPAWPSARR